MEKLTKVVVDCSTGEVEQLDFTEAEVAEYQAMVAALAADKAEREAAEAQKAQDRADAIATLTGLGLTEAQIQALLG